MESDLDDGALMTAFARGEAAAFKKLYNRHKNSLYRFVKRLLGPAMGPQVDEVFQETWMRVIRSCATWSPQGATFRTWLFTIAHNCTVDCFKKSGREASLDAWEGADGQPWEPDARAWQLWPAPATPQGDEVAFWRRAGKRLLSCLEELPLAQKAAFLLHYDDGLSLEDVARALEVEFQSAKSRVRYAVSKLRICMGAYLDPLRGVDEQHGA